MNSTLHWLDYSIVAATVVATVAFGLWFAQRQDSSDKYFAGARRAPSWVVGTSIFATLISSVTFLAYPAAAYKGNWILLVQGLMAPVAVIGMAWVIVPLFRRVIRLSAYEYFERRFGFLARMYSSIAFCFTHFAKMGTVMYLLALALNSVAGFNLVTTIVVLGTAVILLTLLGGMEAVLWMDLAQGLLMIGGGILCLGVLLFSTKGGPVAAAGKALEWEKIGFGPHGWDFSSLTFVVMAINGLFYGVQKYGTDQTIVQRYLAAKNDRGAKRAAYIGVSMSVVLWTLFMLIGTMLYVFYRVNADAALALPDGIKADAVFPYFIKTQLPAGVIGLVLAALISSGISTLDADLNSLAAVGVQDYYQRFRPHCTDRQRLNMGRLLVLLAGLGCMAVALLYVAWDGEGVLGVVFELYAIFSAGIVGMFLLGLLSKRANKRGLYAGIAACVLFTAYAVLTTTSVTIGGTQRLLLDLGSCNFPHHKLMLGVYSHLIVLVVGWLASFLFAKPDEKSLENLTIHAYFKQSRKQSQIR